MEEKKKISEDQGTEVFCKFIVKNGKRIYRKNGGYFHFFVKAKQK